MKALKYLILFIIGLIFTQQPANADNRKIYNRFYVFGDSVSDTGNSFMYTKNLFSQWPKMPPDYPAIPPSISPHMAYYQGRFSNGWVAVEYLWEALKPKTGMPLVPSESVSELRNKRALNFAFGGSGSGISNVSPGGYIVPGVLGQVADFVQKFGEPIPKGALYVIWTGHNDYLLGIYDDPAQVIANISQAIKILYSAGARNFLVPNLLDLGSPPILSDPDIHSYPPGSATALRGLTLIHNRSLTRELRRIRRQHPNINLMSVDVFTFFNRLREFMNTETGPGGDCLFTDPALGGGPYTCTDVPSFSAPNYLFWDVEHPSTEAHRRMGRLFLRKILRNQARNE